MRTKVICLNCREIYTTEFPEIAVMMKSCSCGGTLQKYKEN